MKFCILFQKAALTIAFEQNKKEIFYLLLYNPKIDPNVTFI